MGSSPICRTSAGAGFALLRRFSFGVWGERLPPKSRRRAGPYRPRRHFFRPCSLENRPVPYPLRPLRRVFSPCRHGRGMRCRRMKSGGSSYPVSAGRRKPRRQTVDCCRRRWYDGRTGWRCGDGRHNGTDRADRGIWNVRPALSRPCGHCRDGRRFCVGNKMVARARARRQAGRKGGAPRARRRSKADDILGRRHHARRAAHVVVSCALYLRHLRQTVPVYISGTGIPAPVIRLYYIDNPRRAFRGERKRSAAANVLFLLIPIAAGAGVMCLLHGCAAG